jgi:hypothetical protein
MAWRTLRLANQIMNGPPPEHAATTRIRRKQPRLATLIFQISDLGEDYDDYLSIARG